MNRAGVGNSRSTRLSGNTSYVTTLDDFVDPIEHGDQMHDGSPRITFVLLAHDHPNQLGRLVRRLNKSYPESRVIVHVDARSGALQPFTEACQSANVQFMDDRVRSYWAHHSLLEAELRLLRHAINRPCDWVILLSGRCYPLRDRAELFHHLGQNSIDAFIEVHPVARRSSEHRRRFEEFHMARLSATMPRIHRVTRALLRRIPIRRLPPESVEFFHGSQWWCLSGDASKAVLRQHAEHGRLRRFFRRVWAPDESYVQTIIGNTSQFQVAPPLMYARFEPNSPHPAVWTIDDLPELHSSSGFFARKFDEEIDSSILDRLDEVLDGADSPSQEQ